MTVGNRRDERSDQFPIGMRVLAVDDDHTFLNILEKQLKMCQYHVTTTNRANTALEMLRENNKQFDLVISDVHMPEIDGFKLLELVRLEMNLPVILLSGDYDPKLVRKGITHGACDYMRKPVRLESLKVIWQHVISRKTSDSSLMNRNYDGNATGGANYDQDAKHSRKRLVQVMDDDKNKDDNNHENDYSSSWKKPRVVWSPELHSKFVAAVNQLGLDTVPRKILELMNVERLTRENVASHLQKYRLHLKRMSSEASQQADMVAALYFRTNAVYFHGFNATPQFHNNSLRSNPPSVALGRLNTPARLCRHRLCPSRVAQLGQTQVQASTVADCAVFQPNLMLQVMPSLMEFDQLHKDYTVLNGSGNSILNLSNSSLTMQGRCAQERQNLERYGLNQCISDWPTAVRSQSYSMNPVENMVRGTSPNIPPQSWLQNLSLVNGNVMQNMNYAANQIRDTEFLDRSVNPSMANAQNSCDPWSTSAVLYTDTGFNSMGRQRFDCFATPHGQMPESSSLDMAVDMNQGQQFMEPESLGSYYSANSSTGSLEDIVTDVD